MDIEQSSSPLIASQVMVKTSDIRGAGTDANVTLAMFGQLEGQATNSGTHKLDNSASECGGQTYHLRNASPAPHAGQAALRCFSRLWDPRVRSAQCSRVPAGPSMLMTARADNFERGAIDTFLIKGKDLGDLTHIVVRANPAFGACTPSIRRNPPHPNQPTNNVTTCTYCAPSEYERVHPAARCLPQVTSDGSGLGGAWHLSEVEIFDTVRNRTTVFPCGKWLEPSDMSSLQQTLLPRGVDGALGNLVQYEVRSRGRGCLAEGRPLSRGADPGLDPGVVGDFMRLSAGRMPVQQRGWCACCVCLQASPSGWKPHARGVHGCRATQEPHEGQFARCAVSSFSFWRRASVRAWPSSVHCRSPSTRPTSAGRARTITSASSCTATRWGVCHVGPKHLARCG